MPPACCQAAAPAPAPDLLAALPVRGTGRLLRKGRRQFGRFRAALSSASTTSRRRLSSRASSASRVLSAVASASSAAARRDPPSASAASSSAASSPARARSTADGVRRHPCFSQRRGGGAVPLTFLPAASPRCAARAAGSVPRAPGAAIRRRPFPARLQCRLPRPHGSPGQPRRRRDRRRRPRPPRAPGADSRSARQLRPPGRR